MEYAGAIEVTPPFRASAQDWVRGSRLDAVARRARRSEPRAGSALDDCVGSLRDLVTLDAGERTYEGVVAAYDTDARELVAITVANGRVTVRAAPEGAGAATGRSNVIDLATHRRTISRAIG